MPRDQLLGGGKTCLNDVNTYKKFMDSNGKKRRNKSLWKYLARRHREREGINDIDINTAPNLPSNRWSNKRNKWTHTNDLFKRKGEQLSLSVFAKPVHSQGHKDPLIFQEKHSKNQAR